MEEKIVLDHFFYFVWELAELPDLFFSFLYSSGYLFSISRNCLNWLIDRSFSIWVSIIVVASDCSSLPLLRMAESATL